MLSLVWVYRCAALAEVWDLQTLNIYMSFSSTYPLAFLLPICDESVWLGIIMLPRCFLSLIVPCHPVEKKYMSRIHKGLYSSVCCAPESFCFCKEMIADPFLVLYYSEFKHGLKLGRNNRQWGCNSCSTNARACVRTGYTLSYWLDWCVLEKVSG